MDDLLIGAYCSELLTAQDDFDEYDEVNFDHSTHVDEYCEMWWDSDENESDDDVSEPDPDHAHQSGGGRLQYAIELVRERTIAKFKVKGCDFKVRVSPFDRDVPFDQVVQGLHKVIEGGYFIMIRDGTKCVLWIDS